MTISCFLLLIVSLSSFQVNPVAGLDTIKCLQGKNNCHVHKCPWFLLPISTCYKGKGSCCQKRRWFDRSNVNNE
ncbi:beta-defensin 40-like [Arvicanthis niloticus]|uniref:beta-defensin 40-like n=1 Tax=Arvicanthis niloticus TaxID=61156 RepID=UPI0014868E8D|nr:beta-defensin 40-like [Arvicanthis niloticus]